MQHTYFVIPDFVNEISTQSILSIRLATDGFSFCIHDSRGQLVAFIHEPLDAENQVISLYQLQEYIKKYPLLNLQYAKVFLMPCTREKLLVPDAFYNEHAAMTFYSITQDTHTDDHFLHHHIESLKANLVTTFPESIITFILSHFPQTHIINSAYPFLVESLSRNEEIPPQLFVAIEHQYFDILVMNNKQPVLFNTFDYKNNTDILYHVLNCIQTLEIDSQKVQLTLTGNSPQDALHQLLKRYIPNSRIKVNDRTLNTILNDNSLYYSSFFHLLNLHLCEL